MGDPAAQAGGMADASLGHPGGHRENLTAAKESRKRAELDAQLLANRIALLKQEEEKAWRKIEETRKRASEIFTLRDQNEKKYLAKEQFYQDKWKSIRAAQAQNAYMRDKAKAARDATRDALLENRKTNVRQTKQQSQDHLMQKKEREANERQANQSRSNYIKQQKEEARRRLEQERLHKLDQNHEDYEARISQEDMLLQRTNALVAKMEKEEMELIQRLQNTQTVQRNAYEELEAALGATSQQISTSVRDKGLAPGQPAQGSLPNAPAA
eukprot:gnl/MRDRNA2_/MRDRNA2_19992_c0_seq1.p1 gnl/MRDRNA2_/MRDRNA2_19992_c0~~gnl/MRDRNA2_/MRDRNA2_19992_c0_seq1.p1  ORF type:complete len:270 (-),score=87.74 gnl/MRDRNA2_/MRDRNA2_19992_c0_seq1:56-865(-)